MPLIIYIGRNRYRYVIEFHNLSGLFQGKFRENTCFSFLVFPNKEKNQNSCWETLYPGAIIDWFRKCDIMNNVPCLFALREWCSLPYIHIAFPYSYNERMEWLNRGAWKILPHECPWPFPFVCSGLLLPSASKYVPRIGHYVVPGLKF